MDAVKQKHHAVHQELGRVVRYRAKREERVDESLETNRTNTKQFADASAELREAIEGERRLEHKATSLEKKQQQLASRIEKRQAQLEKWKQKRQKLAARTEIVEADVATDTLFTAMKLTLGMLVHFISVEYFPHRPLEWSTFLSRITTLPGRREITADTITVITYANERDLKLMKALAIACQRINERNLVHDDYRLRYEVEWPGGIPERWTD